MILIRSPSYFRFLSISTYHLKCEIKSNCITLSTNCCFVRLTAQREVKVLVLSMESVATPLSKFSAMENFLRITKAQEIQVSKAHQIDGFSHAMWFSPWFNYMAFVLKAYLHPRVIVVIFFFILNLFSVKTCDLIG